MKINKLLMLALAATTFFTACSSDDDIPDTPEVETGEYTNGIFILNEGVWGQGNSTISYLDEDLEEITHDIFGLENQGAALGDTGQSIGFHEDYAFIIVNASNKVEVVDRNTFESIATIGEGLLNPRYVAFYDGKAFVTNWGDGGDPNDDYVAVIDVESFTIEENIPVAEGPEKVISEGSNIYVAHKGGYNFNNKISVIDGMSFEIEEISVGDLPNSMEVEDGFLWVASGGFPNYSGMESAGTIQKIDLSTNEIVQEYQFSNATDHPQNLTIENNRVLYTLGGEVYTFDSNEDTLPEAAFLELSEVTSLYGFAVKENLIYAASSSSSNNADGKLYIYNATTGNLEKTFDTGINPNGIYFNQ